ncbi:nitroreductase family protein [Alphaproteobacteria bacterium]|nr:nitroreductase family protein [Alphaproteobacteria bacterium]
MKFETEKLIFKKIPIEKIIKNSKKFLKSIKNRRSIRSFNKQKIDITIVKNAILSAGTAPNGANLQPWHFSIIKDKKIKKKIRIAAEKEEKKFYKSKAPIEWLKALEPLGTDANKIFLEDAPILIAVFEKKYEINKGNKIKNYYVKESVGIATGILISCLHISGLCMLTHTPSPMNFLNKILNRPNYEKPFVLLVVGFPNKNCKVPKFASKKKKFEEIASIF